MPSVFPGMDPYIESQVWEDFHTRFVTELSNALVALLRPRYVVRVERRVYVEHPTGESRHLRPDATVSEGPARYPSVRASRPGTGTGPLLLTLPIPEERREAWIAIRDVDGGEVVTVVELLSPSNKRAGSDGRREYLEKRDLVLRSPVHLLEIDLLRGGLRLPTIEPLPEADHYLFVCRSDLRPRAEVRPFSLRDPLPEMPVPLRAGDGDAVVSLSAVFDRVYDQAGYDYSLDYTAAPAPSLPDPDERWARSLLEAAPDS